MKQKILVLKRQQTSEKKTVCRRSSRRNIVRARLELGLSQQPRLRREIRDRSIELATSLVERRRRCNDIGARLRRRTSLLYDDYFCCCCGSNTAKMGIEN